MKTLIAYASTGGGARTAAELLGDHLDPAVIVDLKTDPRPDIGGFDAVVIGGSIRMGRIQKQVRSFCRANLDALRGKKLGLYVCCMREGKEAQEQFEMAYPPTLREHAGAVGLFGGEFVFSRMKLLERIIVKRVAGISEDVSTLDHGAIAQFANDLR